MRVQKDYNGYKVLMHPLRNEWQVMLHKGAPDDEGLCEVVLQHYDHEPTMDEIRRDVLAEYNRQIDEAILTGYRYEGALVYLSAENQRNYKTAYDLAKDFGTLPVTFKLGTELEPVYKEFKTLEELGQFIVGCATYVGRTLAVGWARKDRIDWTKYEDAIKDL